MEHSLKIAPLKTPAASSVTAQPDDDWGRLMQETAASAPAVDLDDATFKGQRTDLDGQVQRLQNEISRMMNDHHTLSKIVGEAQSHQQSQISMLMTMIASLSRKISIGGNPKSHETRHVYGMMSSLQSALEAQRSRNRSEGATAEVILGQMQGLQGSLERALAQILQQLSALHMRMGSLV